MSDIQVLLRHAKRSKDTKLDLSNKGISYFPNEIFALEQLEILILSGNQLTSIDTRIENLTNLKILDVSNNSIMDLPIELIKLTSLQALSVSGNPLYNKFEALLDKEASIAPELKLTLEKCFGLSSN
jgi:Leucine-rich repeat (LRR) protein